MHVKLAPPPRQTGPIGDIALQDPLGPILNGTPTNVPDYGADITVVAVREPADEVSLFSVAPKVTTSNGPVSNAAILWDGDLDKTITVPKAESGPSWLQYEFARPVTVQSITFSGGPRANLLSFFFGETGNGPMLQSSADGKTFTDIVRVPTAAPAQQTVTFAPITARYFRVLYKSQPGQVAEFRLYSEARVNRYEDKAAFGIVPDLYVFPTPGDAPAVSAKETVDLSSKDVRRRHARLDAASRPLDGSPHGLLADGRYQSPGPSRSYRS